MSGRVTVRSSASVYNFVGLLLLIVVAAVALAMPNGVARAQQSGDAASAASQPGGELAVQEKTMSIGVGRSQLVKTPFPTKTISIVDKKVADVQVISPT